MTNNNGIRQEIREIKFEKGQMFGPKVTDPIKENDFFIDCYKKAAKQILEILESNTKDDVPIYKIKNIISFLGERGQGKTSIMRSFVLALKKKNKELFDNELEKYEFVDLDIVDPSTFEDCSTVLDCVLGQLLDMVQNSNQESAYDLKDEIYRNFNNIYSEINIIKDKNLLNNNLDIYDSSIETLMKINNILKIKKSLIKLIDNCLKAIKRDKKNTILIIPIDDIDIDIKNCYETVETIRKYLTIPNVIIIMAAKLEQLHEGIRAEKLKGFNHSNVDSEKVYEDIYNMTTKYLLKLLPQNRRIHIPFMGNSINLLQYHVNYNLEDAEPFLTLEASISQILYKKTGILLLCTNQIHNYLITSNLRDIIDLYTCLNEMDDPNTENEISTYISNLEKFKDYFLNNWCTNNLTFKSARFIRRLYNEGGIYKNHTLISMLSEIVENDKDAKKYISDLLNRRGKKELFYDLSDVSYILNKIENHKFNISIHDVNKFVYAVKLCYTIIMNQLCFTDLLYKKETEISRLTRFIGGRILKSDVLNKFKNEDGSIIKTENISNIISNKINKFKKKNDIYWRIISLLSATSYDKKRDIYFYGSNNRTCDAYYDPNLFFVNCLNIRYLKNFLENDKFYCYESKENENKTSDTESNESNSKSKELTNKVMDTKSKEPDNKNEEDNNINETDNKDTADTEINNSSNNVQTIKKYSFEEILNSCDINEHTIDALEIVARTTICNFQLYDFLIDSLDLRYLPPKEKRVNIDTIYIQIISWLTQLHSDLNKQNPKYFNKKMVLMQAITEVMQIIDNIDKKIKTDCENNIIDLNKIKIIRN